MVIPVLIALTLAGQSPTAAALTMGAPQKLLTLDKIKGEPTQIAWSPDATEVYVATGARTRLGTFESPKHYVITVADQKLKSVDAAPQWATDYLAWKSNKWAPGDHAFTIAVSEGERTERAVSAPMGGDLAKGGGGGDSTGTTSSDMVSAALTSQRQHVITLKLKGEIVGELVDTQFIPGYTFSWAPQSFGTAIAYARPDGHLSVMDHGGGKKEVPGTKNALLPAWADSGSKIAFVQRDGKKFDLYVVDVK